MSGSHHDWREDADTERGRRETNGTHKTEEQRRLDNLEAVYSSLRSDMKDVKTEIKAIPLGLGTLRKAVDDAVHALETRGWPRWAVTTALALLGVIAACVAYSTWKAGG